MTVSNLFGRGCCVLGTVLMVIGSVLVPVNAPVWADDDPGTGTHQYCDGNAACETRSGTPLLPGLCAAGGNPCTPTGQGGVTSCNCVNPPAPSAHLCRCFGS